MFLSEMGNIVEEWRPCHIHLSYLVSNFGRLRRAVANKQYALNSPVDPKQRYKKGKPIYALYTNVGTREYGRFPIKNLVLSSFPGLTEKDIPVFDQDWFHWCRQMNARDEEKLKGFYKEKQEEQKEKPIIFYNKEELKLDNWKTVDGSGRKISEGLTSDAFPMDTHAIATVGDDGHVTYHS